MSRPLPRVVRRTPRPLHPCRPASAEARNRAVGPASNPLPSGLLPSGLGMAKPTIPQAEVLWGALQPGMGHERRFLKRLVTGARNGLAMSAQGPGRVKTFFLHQILHATRRDPRRRDRLSIFLLYRVWRQYGHNFCP